MIKLNSKQWDKEKFQKHDKRTYHGAIAMLSIAFVIFVISILAVSYSKQIQKQFFQERSKNLLNISSKMGDMVLKGYKTALKFEVVTSYPEEMSQEIIKKLKHSATVVHAQGMYTHQDKALLICVVNKNQIIDFENIIKKYPGSFAYITSVNETVGNFVRTKKLTSKED